MNNERIDEQGSVPGLPVILETINPETGEVIEIDLGRSLTIKDFLASKGVPDRYGRSILVEMGLLHLEAGRLRLKAEHVSDRLGNRMHMKGSKHPFDVLYPSGQAWVEERWDEAKAAVDARKAQGSPTFQAASLAMDEYREWRGEPMTTQMQVCWLLDHFPDLTVSEVADVLSVTDAIVKKWSAARAKQRQR